MSEESAARHQSYYADGGLQPVEYMAAKKWLEGWVFGSVLKYISRDGKKSNTKEDILLDLNKAIACIQIWIDHLEGKKIG